MSLFEGLKKIGKKTALGTGAFVASISALEASGQEANISDFQNSEQTEIPSEQYRSNFIKYMEHPSYKQRLAKEMFGDEKIDKEKNKKIEEEFEKRLNKIKTIPIKMNPDIENEERDGSFYDGHDNNPRIESTPHAINHELQHGIDYDYLTEVEQPGFEERKDNFIGDSKKIYLDFLESQETKQNNADKLELAKIIKEYVLNNGNNIKFKIPIDNFSEYETPYNYVLAMAEEELGTDLYQFYSYFNIEDREKIRSNNKELIDRMENYRKKMNELLSNYTYYGRSTEIKGRLTHLRTRAWEEFNFNLKKDFDINKFPELKNDRQYKELRDKLHLTDEQINELMKYTAYNETNKKNDKTYYPPEFWENSNGNQA